MVTLAALAFGRHASREAYDRLLTGAASQIAGNVLLRDGRIQVDLPVSAFDLLALAEDDRVFYRVIDSEGATITGYEEFAAPETRTADRQFYMSEYRGESIRALALRRRFAERTFSGSVDVLVAHTLLARRSLAWEMVANALLVLAVAGVAIIGLAVFAIRSALQPLRRIERDLALRDPKDLNALDVRVPRELQTVVAVINRFMGRLDDQMNIMRNLIADSAHQLRTPIAAIRAQAQLAADETDPERLRGIVAHIHTRSVGLSQLTDQLLNHAMIIHRADSAPLMPLDLRTVAMRSADDFDQTLAGVPVRLDLELPEFPVMLDGDALSLIEACKNLVNNARTHGVPPITLVVLHEAGVACLTVRDRGRGIPADRSQRLDSRFRRTGDRRDRGTGLGLSIANEVVQAHCGVLRFSFTDAQEFEATMAFPDAATKTGSKT